jgi:hypothetical protein
VARVRAGADAPVSCPYQPESIRCLVDSVARPVGVPHGSRAQVRRGGVPRDALVDRRHDNTTARSTARAASWHSIYGKMAIEAVKP